MKVLDSWTELGPGEICLPTAWFFDRHLSYSTYYMADKILFFMLLSICPGQMCVKKVIRHKKAGSKTNIYYFLKAEKIESDDDFLNL